MALRFGMLWTCILDLMADPSFSPEHCSSSTHGSRRAVRDHQHGAQLESL